MVQYRTNITFISVKQLNNKTILFLYITIFFTYNIFNRVTYITTNNLDIFMKYLKSQIYLTALYFYRIIQNTSIKNRSQFRASVTQYV